jgi:hypothetical protein
MSKMHLPRPQFSMTICIILTAGNNSEFVACALEITFPLSDSFSNRGTTDEEFFSARPDFFPGFSQWKARMLCKTNVPFAGFLGPSCNITYCTAK